MVCWWAESGAGTTILQEHRPRIVCQSQGKSTGNYSVSSRGHVRRSTSGLEMLGAVSGRVERRKYQTRGVAGAAASETPHFLSKHRPNHQDNFRETSLCSDEQLKSGRYLCSEALVQLRLSGSAANRSYSRKWQIKNRAPTRSIMPPLMCGILADPRFDRLIQRVLLRATVPWRLTGAARTRCVVAAPARM